MNVENANIATGETRQLTRTYPAGQMAAQALSLKRRVTGVNFGTDEKPQRYTVLTHPLCAIEEQPYRARIPSRLILPALR